MGIYDNSVMKAVSRRTMTIFFLIDTSGSMNGAKIGEVNLAIEEVLPEIRSISAGNSDANIKIAVLEFSCGADWITTDPVEVESYTWAPLDAGGLTDFGRACFMLEQKLHKEEFMRDEAGCYAPTFILLSDGAPTDEYAAPLKNLWKNNWFKKGMRIAIAIGQDANLNMLLEFTGNPDTVLLVHTPEHLRRLIRFVSVTASQIGSKSSGVGAENGTDTVQSRENVLIEAIHSTPEITSVANMDPGDWEW